MHFSLSMRAPENTVSRDGFDPFILDPQAFLLCLSHIVVEVPNTKGRIYARNFACFVLTILCNRIPCLTTLLDQLQESLEIKDVGGMDPRRCSRPKER